MNDKRVYFLVKTTKKIDLDHYFLCAYCRKYFDSRDNQHSCLSFTKGKEWKEVTYDRKDCILFVLLKYNKEK